MALDAAKLAKNIAAKIAPDKTRGMVEKNWLPICEAIVEHIQSDMEITIPNGKVIVSVTGQASGTPNPAPIPCDVDGGA